MLIQVPTAVQGLKTATVRRWLKKLGETARAGETLVELDVEDAIVALQAGADGVLARIVAPAGQTVAAGCELGSLEAGAGNLAAEPAKAAAPSPAIAPAPAGIPIMMPQAGNSMEEGTLLKWRVKIGERVALGQVICEVETDKATVEVEATAAGKIAWLAAEGSVIPVKQPIAILGDAPIAAATPAAAAAPASPVPASAIAPMAIPANVTPVLMPQAGNTMEEGTIVKWRAKVGDRIAVGQILCEIETDKATVELESTDAGRLAKIVAPEGAVVPVKQAIAYLAENDADVAAISPGAAPAMKATPAMAAKTEVAAAVATTPAARVQSGRVRASPAARKLAAEKGIELASIGAGSGPEGRILSTDLASVKPGSRLAVAPARPAGKASASPASREIAPAGPMAALSGGKKPLSKMRKAIATNLQVSKQTIPHFYVKLTIIADPLFAFYRAQKPATGCTLNDVILLAVGRVVGEIPAFRSRLEGGEIVEIPAANIGVAVSVPDGLVVPVVLNIHALTLAQLAAEARRVVESARNGKIENMGKGVFTISNMGMLGVEDFAAIINPPESGILAISGVRESVIVKDGAMRPGRVMSMTLSVDHRVVDGSLAAGFMARLRDLLESPEKLLG